MLITKVHDEGIISGSPDELLNNPVGWYRRWKKLIERFYIPVTTPGKIYEQYFTVQSRVTSIAQWYVSSRKRVADSNRTEVDFRILAAQLKVYV